GAGAGREGGPHPPPSPQGPPGARAPPPLPALASWCVLGELGLDGRIHAVRGVLPIAAAARRARLGGLLVPAANAGEAALAGGPPVVGVDTLASAVAYLRGEEVRAPTTVDASTLLANPPPPPAP